MWEGPRDLPIPLPISQRTKPGLPFTRVQPAAGFKPCPLGSLAMRTSESHQGLSDPMSQSVETVISVLLGQALWRIPELIHVRGTSYAKVLWHGEVQQVPEPRALGV